MKKRTDYIYTVTELCKSRFSQIDTVIAGVSGGPDSVFLFFVLLHLKKRFGFDLHAIHINHNLRGCDSQADEHFVTHLAQTHNIPLKICQVNVCSYLKEKGISIEMAARELRYQSYKKYAKKINATIIATGHTADDKIETALMRLITGCGLAGMTGLRHIRQDGNLSYIRPLLMCWKKDIVQWLNNAKFKYRKDKSNTSPIFTRNKVRNSLIPFIENKFNTHFKSTFLTTLELIEKQHTALESNIDTLSAHILLKNSGLHIFDKSTLLTYPEGIICTLILRSCFALSSHSSRTRIGYTHIKPLINKLRDTSASIFTFPGNLLVILDKSFMYIGQNNILRTFLSPTLFHYRYKIHNNITLIENFMTISICTLADSTLDYSPPTPEIYANRDLWNTLYSGNKITLQAYIPLQKNITDIIIRTRQAGDRIHTYGGTKKLKKLYIDKKVPFLLRKILPLITYGQNILWTPVIGRLHKITSNEKNLSIKISLKLNFSETQAN